MARTTLVWAVFSLAYCHAGGAELTQFSAETLERAFDMGCSLVVGEVLSVHNDGRLDPYRTRIARVIVAGDLDKSDVQSPVNLFAGVSYRDALKPGRHYALFVMKDSPYQFSWAFRDDVIEVDSCEAESLRPLIIKAGDIYERSPIRRFRKTQPWYGGRELPALPEDLAALCKEFRRGLRWRSGVAEKIYESDLGSRHDETSVRSSMDVFLRPKLSPTRQEILALLDRPTLKRGWTYLWHCDDFQTAKDRDEVGILSVTFDENDRVKRLLYGREPKSHWLRRWNATERLAEIDGDPAGVIARFQQALKDGHWDQALALCSPALQAEAGTCDSAEQFFTRYMPVQEVTKGRLQPHSSSSIEGRTVRLGDVIELYDRDEDDGYRWHWSLARDGQEWCVDFEPIPLASAMEKAKAVRAFQKAGSRADPEEFAQAIRCVLTPQSDEFTLGQPMLFDLEMQNAGDKPVVFYDTDFMAQDPMVVTDSKGQVHPCADAGAQICMAPRTILPDETIVLAKDYDVTSQYRILQPGPYTFQFKTHRMKSNPCTVEVRPGPLLPMEQVIEQLLPVLPARWSLRRSVATRPPDSRGVGTVAHLFISLSGKPGGKGNRYGMTLLVLLDGDPFDADPWLREWYDYWGPSPWGPVYARVNEVESLWPDYRAAIAKALEISR